MTGYAHEWEAGKDEGARAVWQTQPVAFVGERHASRGPLRAASTTSKQPIAGTEHERRRPTSCCSRSASRSSASSSAALAGVSVEQRPHRRRRATAPPAARGATPAATAPTAARKSSTPSPRASAPPRAIHALTGCQERDHEGGPMPDLVEHRRHPLARTRSGWPRRRRPTPATRSCAPSTPAGAARCGRRSASRSRTCRAASARIALQGHARDRLQQHRAHHRPAARGRTSARSTRSRRSYPKHAVIVSLMVETREEWQDIIKRVDRRRRRRPRAELRLPARHVRARHGLGGRPGARRSTSASPAGRSSSRRCRCS